MPLIDRTYFDGSLLLTGVNEASVRARMDAAIAFYEPMFLSKVLGPSLYAAFRAGLVTGNRSFFSRRFSSRFRRSPMDSRWHWLRDGLTYQDQQGRTHTWPGLTNSLKQSPIACYVYWMYRSENVTQTNSTGTETSGKHENTASVSADRKMIAAWSRMAELNQSLFHMLANLYDSAGEIVYPEPELSELDMTLFLPNQNMWGI